MRTPSCFSARVRKRIQVLKDTKIDGYEMVIHELGVVLDLLVRARDYIVNVSSKRKD